VYTLYMKKLMLKKGNGFTIIELLIVIVVIGILALLSLNTLSGVQEDAKTSKAQSDIGKLSSSLAFAKVASGQTLIEITSNNCSECACRTALIGAELPRTHPCWTDYELLLGQIELAGGEPLTDFYGGDAWGSPYMLDQNEGEFGPTDCRPDLISSAGPDRNLLADTDNITRELPLSISCS